MQRQAMLRTIACLTAVVTAPPPASAQDDAGLRALREGNRIWVTTTDGREQQGRVGSVSPTHLDLRLGRVGDDATVIPLGDIRRIDRGDPLTNGFRNGAVTGAALLGGFGLFLSQALCESTDGCLRSDLGPLLTIAGVGAAIGMAGGGLIDFAIKGRRLVYAAPGTPATLQLLPQVSPTSVGARIRLTWPRPPARRASSCSAEHAGLAPPVLLYQRTPDSCR